MGAWIEIVTRRMQPHYRTSLPLWERGLKSKNIVSTVHGSIVAPLVGAWIEISCISKKTFLIQVAPLVGAWIEITVLRLERLQCESLPLWERGLKYLPIMRAARAYSVAPLVGAWIEINVSMHSPRVLAVAPLVGAWIEIHSTPIFGFKIPSLPLWERGLK